MWQNHLFDYLLLLTGAVFFVLAMKLFAGERNVQILLVISFSGFYILWGIYHHIITKTLRLRVLLEYVLIGMASLFFLLTLALR